MLIYSVDSEYLLRLIQSGSQPQPQPEQPRPEQQPAGQKPLPLFPLAPDSLETKPRILL